MKPIVNMGGLVLVALVLAASVNALSPNGIAWVGQWDTAVGVISARANGAQLDLVREIHSVAEAKALYDSGDVLFVDARSDSDFLAGHVAGAISVPEARFDDFIDSLITRYDMDNLVITYCSGRTCEDSHHLARSLAEIGYADVRVMIDGYPAWQSKGYPVEP